MRVSIDAMESMPRREDGSSPVVIFGAGKTGRGFLAHLCQDAGVPFVLVDRDRNLVEALRRHGSYEVRVLSTPERVVTLRPEGVYAIDGPWEEAFARTSLCFTAVFGNQLGALGETLAPVVARRLDRTEPSRPGFNFVTCENWAGAATTLRSAVSGQLNAAQRARAERSVGFAEAIVLKTCLAPAAGAPPLSVQAQDLFELPLDAEALRAPLPAIPGLRPQEGFQHQLTRKLYTYNCINAVLTYLGARRGLDLLSEAAADPEVYACAERAGGEAGRALVAEFGFDSTEQQAWQAAALEKFADPRVPDPLARNGADPRRKLARDDRLVGPALLALRHGIEPRAIAEGILAALDFEDGGAPALSTGDGFPGPVLEELCGLQSDEPLYGYLASVWEETSRARR